MNKIGVVICFTVVVCAVGLSEAGPLIKRNEIAEGREYVMCVEELQDDAEKNSIPFEVLIQGPTGSRFVRSLLNEDFVAQNGMNPKMRSSVTIYKPNSLVKREADDKAEKPEDAPASEDDKALGAVATSSDKPEDAPAKEDAKTNEEDKPVEAANVESATENVETSTQVAEEKKTEEETTSETKSGAEEKLRKRQTEGENQEIVDVLKNEDNERSAVTESAVDASTQVAEDKKTEEETTSETKPGAEEKLRKRQTEGENQEIVDVLENKDGERSAAAESTVEVSTQVAEDKKTEEETTSEVQPEAEKKLRKRQTESEINQEIADVLENKDNERSAATESTADVTTPEPQVGAVPGLLALKLFPFNAALNKGLISKNVFTQAALLPARAAVLPAQVALFPLNAQLAALQARTNLALGLPLAPAAPIAPAPLAPAPFGLFH